MKAVYRDTMNVSGLIDHAQKLVDLGYTAFQSSFYSFYSLYGFKRRS